MAVHGAAAQSERKGCEAQDVDLRLASIRTTCFFLVGSAPRLCSCHQPADALVRILFIRRLATGALAPEKRRFRAKYEVETASRVVTSVDRTGGRVLLP